MQYQLPMVAVDPSRTDAPLPIAVSSVLPLRRRNEPSLLPEYLQTQSAPQSAARDSMDLKTCPEELVGW